MFLDVGLSKWTNIFSYIDKDSCEVIRDKLDQSELT